MVISCLSLPHDAWLLLLAALTCVIGVYGSFAVAAHAARTEGRGRGVWAGVSVISAGCTAWGTHMIALLAFRPGMATGIEPMLTAASLLTGTLGIGAGVVVALKRPGRPGRFASGLVIGSGIAVLHYLGQAGYAETARVSWDHGLVLASVAAALTLSSAAVVAAGERPRWLRRLAAPALLGSIAVLHFGGMAAQHLTFDPLVALPAGAVPPDQLAPLMALVSLVLLGVALTGLRFSVQAQLRRRRDRDRLRELADVAVEGLVVCDGNTMEAVNVSLERLVMRSKDALRGQSVQVILPGLDLSNLPERVEQDAVMALPHGERAPVRVVRSHVLLGGRRCSVVAVRDQRERLQAEAAMHALAFSDRLTGLPNRTRFHDLLDLQAASRRDRDGAYAVLLVDLDGFKLVNDTLGHGMGDQLLVRVADRLRSAVRDGDVVARLGGDEFVILQTEASDPERTRALAARVVDLLGRAFLIGGQLIHVGASVGVAMAPGDGCEPEQLLRNADLALYKAKADGKATFRLFEPELDARMQARRGMEADLRRALSRQEFEVHYQPLVDTRSGEVTSAEALVRWRHPDRGLVSPADFIPLAEETGLISALGLWVLRTACTDAVAWPKSVRLAVNLSPVQFRDLRLAETIKAVLSATGLAPERLELEITEGVLLADEERTLGTLSSLRRAGVRISMDDFGTGYSSLSYLRRFPFDKIKIDQSFVRQLPGDAESAAIVRAILTLGSCLGMSTTVEGVETAEQFAFTAAEGCDQVQGYHVSRPLPLAAFLSFIKQEEAA